MFTRFIVICESFKRGNFILIYVFFFILVFLQNHKFVFSLLLFIQRARQFSSIFFRLFNGMLSDGILIKTMQSSKASIIRSYATPMLVVLM